MARYADLVELALQNKESQSTAYTISRLTFSTRLLSLPVVPESITTWLRHIWLMTYSRYRVWKAKTDLLHVLDGSYAYLVPGSPKTPTVTTVHDLIPLLQQDGQFGQCRGSYLAQRLITLSINGLRRSSRLLAVSSNTAKDVVRYAGVSASNIAITPLPLDPGFADAANLMKRQEDKSGSFILHVGNNGYYKNREGVVRIFSSLSSSHETKLVLAGPPPSTSLLEAIKNSGLESRVEFVVNQGDSELLELYSGASLFLFPSLYEGFGWPPLEAMACACPVVCSTEGSLPEVVGDAALTAPAEDEEGLARHCMDILNDPKLAEAMGKNGRERASEFTIERMRSGLLAAYQYAIE
jgi:glycosyltransferase involved in cell wall biosynthesis